MPAKTPVDRLRQQLRTAHQAVDALASAMGALKTQAGKLVGILEDLEGQLEVMEQESSALDVEGPGDQVEVPQLSPEELDIASVKMLLTFQEAAGLLSLSVAAVKDMASRGKLPVCKLGRTVRIPVKQLREHIEAGQGEGKGAGVQHPK